MGPASGIAHSGLAIISGLQRQATAVFLVIFSLLCCSPAVAAKNWSINPGIQLSETYTDNVAPGSGESDESDFITQINPVLKAELNGNRIQANLNYRMQNLFYKRNNNENDTFHQFLARASAEVLPEHFFIDASSSQTQRIIFTDGVRVRNNYNISGNRTNQLTTSIRPSWYQPIGTFAEALLNYAHGIVKYDEASTSDSSLDAASLAIYSLSAEQPLSWNIIAQGQNIDYDDNTVDDVELRNTGLLLGYRIIPTLSPLALIGYEDNDFGDRLTSTDPTGPIWALGFSWRPNTRTELEVLAGDRFFGNTYRVKWRQRGRYFSSGLSYSEEINGEATSALQGVSLIDNPYEYLNSSLNLTNDVYLSKALVASANFEKSKTSITITPYHEKREFENSIEDQTYTGITGKWAWAFAARSTFTITLHRDKTKDSSGGNSFFTWSDLKLKRELGKQTTASLIYSYTKSDSVNKQLSYTENAISVSLTHYFGTPAQKSPEPPSRRSRKQPR